METRSVYKIIDRKLFIKLGNCQKYTKLQLVKHIYSYEVL